MKNIFSFLFVGFVLAASAFQAASLRAAITLLTRETSHQQKLFWSSLQSAIIAGFLCLALDFNLYKSLSFLIGWVATMSFSYFTKFGLAIRVIVTTVVTLPLLFGITITHPILSFIFALLSRSFLLVLLPLAIAACFEPHALRLSDFLWRQLLSFDQLGEKVFLPVQLPPPIPIFVIWIYLLALMICFLTLENKKAKVCGAI